ncbi:phage tail protein [filamentous cyanobacterium CCP3]|nr:phage tail protein [filamentous cyanobacterium CCP3]
MADYPLPKFHFNVTAGDLAGGFTEVSGLDMETEPIEYREGNMAQHSKLKMPGMQKFSNITLKRGTFKGINKFYDWWKSATNEADHTKYQRNMTITLLNESAQVVVTWNVTNAFPIKVQGTDLKADGNEIAIETIEIVHEGLTVANG